MLFLYSSTQNNLPHSVLCNGQIRHAGIMWGYGRAGHGTKEVGDNVAVSPASLVPWCQKCTWCPDGSANAAGERLSVVSAAPPLQWRCRLGLGAASVESGWGDPVVLPPAPSVSSDMGLNHCRLVVGRTTRKCPVSTPTSSHPQHGRVGQHV